MSGQTGARYLRAHPTFIMCLQQVIMKLRQQDIMVYANIQMTNDSNENNDSNGFWSNAMAYHALYKVYNVYTFILAYWLSREREEALLKLCTFTKGTLAITTAGHLLRISHT